MGGAGGKAYGLIGPEMARLSPSMSSRKLLVLDFIKRYFARWGESPTLGEIAGALGISRKRAHELVHQLSTEKMIEVVAGKPRGIRLLDTNEELSEGEILVKLSQLGWTIGDGNQVIQPPGYPTPLPLTDKGLPHLPFLDHVPSATGPGTGTSGKEHQSR